MVYLNQLAKEEFEFWREFPRNNKFYHSYLRKINALYDLRERTDGPKDSQLLLALCLDLMPHVSADYKAKVLDGDKRSKDSSESMSSLL